MSDKQSYSGNANIYMERKDGKFHVSDRDWDIVGVAETFPQALKNLAEKYPDDLH